MSTFSVIVKRGTGIFAKEKQRILDFKIFSSFVLFLISISFSYMFEKVYGIAWAKLTSSSILASNS